MEPFNLKYFRSDLSLVCNQIAIDSRTISETHPLFVALHGKKDGHAFVADAAEKGALYALVEEGFSTTAPITLIHVPNTLHALQEIAAAYRKRLKARFIAIIGSEGKTHVKDCLATLLRPHFRTFCSPESYNSQLGVALSLLECSKDDEIALIEAAVSLPGEMARLAAMIDPEIVIMTSLTSKYASTLGSQQIEELLKMGEKARITLVPKGVPGALCWDSGLVQPKAKGSYMIGEHAICLAHPFPYADKTLELSYKTAEYLGLNQSAILEGLAHFDPAPQQTEVWSSSWGTTFINAPYCQSLLALAKALTRVKQLSYRGKRFVLFFDKISNCSKLLESAQIDEVYFIGEQNTLPLTCTSRFFADKEEACQALSQEIGRDDTVLLIGSTKQHLDQLVHALMDMLGESRLTIKLSAIEHNIHEIRAHSGMKRIMVMLKAFGYGTDNLLLAKFLTGLGIDIFGVAHVDEAILLKRKGVKGSFFVINVAPHEAEKAVMWDVEVGLSSLELLEALETASQKQQKKTRVHLHVDTGMGRFGARREEVLKIATAAKNSPYLILEGLMTHFSCADMESEDCFTARQITLFRDVITSLQEHGINLPWIHAANSSATVRTLFPEGNMIRLGLALFGIKNAKEMKYPLTLRPALTLTTKIAGINHLKRGEALSYGKTYIEEKEASKIAILPLGYFDGLHRHYSGKSHLLIAGQKSAMVGRICMDFMMCDITHIDEVSIGDEVLVFGQDSMGHFIEPEALAEDGGTIAHELITCLGPRIQRIFVDS